MASTSTKSKDDLQSDENAAHIENEKSQNTIADQGESGQDVPVVDPETEKKLIRKLDLHIIPMVMWMYLMSFMDRVNIGNARLYGLEEDLGIEGDEAAFQVAVAVLFITYALFEAPSNMILKQARPRWYLAFLTLAWGLTATFSGFVQNYAGLIACRLILGLFEAGLFPGLVVYLTIFYNKRYIATRNAYLFGTAAISGAIGGLVAYAIGNLDNVVDGYRAWRWIFIINGLLTVVTAPIIPFMLADKPENARWLTDEDRKNMVLLRQAEIGQSISGQEFNKKDAKEAFKDWKVWAMAAAQFGVLTMLYSFSIFLPTIIQLLGEWNVAEVQLLTIPVHGIGAILYLLMAFWSDRIQKRGPFILVFVSIAIFGYILLVSNAGNAVSFAGCFFVGAGCYLSVGLPMSWLTLNSPRYGKRTTATGIQLTIGNSSGILAPFLYLSGFAPEFTMGYSLNIGLLCLSLGVYVTMFTHWTRLNKRKLRGDDDYLTEGKSREEIADLGDKNPAYLFTT